MIHKACMPVYMNSGKIVADGRDGKFEGSTRGPGGPKKKYHEFLLRNVREHSRPLKITVDLCRMLDINSNFNAFQLELGLVGQ